MKDYETWAQELQPAIDNAGDSATVVSVLTKSRDDYRDAYAEMEALNQKQGELQAEVERLTTTNRELFLRIGQQITPEKAKDTTDDRADTITINDLFKED